jgi:hypothetical protein
MDNLKRTAQHAAKIGRHHHALVADIKKSLGITKAAKADLENIDLEKLRKILESFLEHFSAMGDECADYAEDCAKAANEADAEKVAAALKASEARFTKRDGADALVPTEIRKVLPTPPGLTAVPRNGQQPLAMRPNVAPEFQKFVAIETGDDEAPLG